MAADDEGADLGYVPDGASPALLDDKPALGLDTGQPPAEPAAGPGPKRKTQPAPTAPSPEIQGAAFVATQKDPDRHAKVVALADRLHLTPNFVEQNYDALSQASDKFATQDAMAQVSPTLQNWLADPDNASIAKKELAPLAQVDKGARLLAPPTRNDGGILDATGTATATGMADLARSTGLLAAAFGLTTPSTAAGFIADMKQRSNALRSQAPDYAKEYQSAVATHEGDLEQARNLFLSGQGPARKAGILNSLLNFFSSATTNTPIDPAAAQTLGETLGLIGAHLSRPRGLAYQGVESLASMAPMMAGTMAGGAGGAAIGSVVPGVGTAVGATVGGMAGTFAGMAPINVGAEVEAEMQKRGIDLSDANAVEKALGDPALMQLIRSKALKAGVTSAAVMSLFTGFAGRLTAAVEPETLAAKLATHVGESTVQAAGVAAGGEAGHVAKGEKMDPARALSTTLQMMGVGAGMEALGESRRAMFHAEPHEAAAEATTQAADAMRAQHDAQALAEVGQAVKEAQTTASVPDRLKSLIETATGGREAATVYFQSDEWDKYWQSQGASPAKAAADIMGDGGKGYHDAQSTGARIAIPLGDYISKVAPTEHFEGLLDVARTRPDGMSFAEAHEYLQSLPATMHEIATEASGAGKAEEPAAESARGVGAKIEQDLIAVGVSPTAAKAQGALYESTFRTLGARAGVDPKELYDRYNLQVTRGKEGATPEVAEKLAKAKKTAKVAGDQEKTLTKATAELEKQAASPEPEIAEKAKGRLKFLEPITPTFSDEAEAARLEEEEGAVRAQPLARPRTEGGRLKNLSKATPEELANEYKILTDANAVENIAPSAIETGHGETWTGMKPGAMKAAGRVAARAKTIAKLEAEMQKRGIDPAEAYMAGYRNSINQEPTGFDFNQSLFHGSSFPISDFQNRPLYLTDDEGFAKSYADSRGTSGGNQPRVYKFDVPEGMKLATREDLADVLKELHMGPGEISEADTAGKPKVVEALKEKGFDGVSGAFDFGHRSDHEELPVTVVFDPHKWLGDQLRRTFDEAAGKLTETPAFKKWFGDSKIVDENGEPLRAVHYTNADFDTFDHDKGRAGSYTSGGKRGYTTDYGRGYVFPRNGFFFFLGSDVPAGVGSMDRAIPSYLSIKNPLDLEKGLSPEESSKLIDYMKETESTKPSPGMAGFNVKGKPAGGLARARKEGMTGQQVFDFITMNINSDRGRKFDALLKDMGYDGMVFPANSSGTYLGEPMRGPGDGKAYRVAVALDPKQIKSAIGNSGAFSSESPNFLEQAARGRITFGDGKPFNIELLAKADRSTFLHETGHFYLEVLGDLAKQPDADSGIAADYATVREWVGAEGDAPFTREQHEQFARGFERYLMEGKSPSPALRSAFFRFKNWLINIYQHVGALHVNLSPEVRGVFDRMIASRDEIAQAEAESATAPLFPDPKAAGMSDTQAASYSKAIADAHQSAEEELTTKMMRDVVREQSAEWKSWRDPMRAEIEQEVSNRPVYKALDGLRTGDVKLNRESITATYGKEFADKLPKGITALKENGGANADVVAEMYGFANGRELVDELSKAGPKKTLIDFLTDQRMQQEHGERPDALDIKESALEAVRAGAKREQLLRKELEHLASDNLPALKGMVRKISRAIPPTDEVRARAAEIIGAKKIQDVRPDLFEKAAARAATEAREALLRGDFDGAFDAKRKELLANEVFRSATDAKADVDQAIDEFKKVFRNDTKLADSRDLDLVNAARAVLASFGIGRSDKPAAQYLKQMKNYDPSMYEIIEPMVQDATENARNFKDLSVDEFRAMRDAVQGMWELSRSTRQVEVDGQKMDRRDLQDAMTQQLKVTTKGRPERQGFAQAKTKWDTAKRTLQSGKGWLTRIEHLADYLDGNNPARPFSRYLFGPVSEAATRYRVRMAEELGKYSEVVKTLKGAKEFKDIEAPELNYVFKDRTELLGALLHTGNESNLRKFLLGAAKNKPAFGDLAEDGTLDTSRWDRFTTRMRKEGVLTKADYDYVQHVWDQMESIKPDAQKAHKQMYGRYFDEITAKPFENEFGRYAGGYYPAKADPFLTTDAQAHEDREALLGAQNSFMFPSTTTGFTKSRVEGYTKPLIMDASLVPSHISAVLRFAEIQPHIRDVARMVTSPEFRPHLDDLDPTLANETLVPWLQRAASQRSEEPGRMRWLDNAARELRNRSGLQIMFANATVLAEQLTHFPSVVVKVPAEKLFGSFWRYVRNPQEFAADINEKSAMMKTRESAAMMEAKQSINKIMLDPSIVQSSSEWMKEHGRFLMTAVQSAMDHTTWAAAYDHASTSSALGGMGLDEGAAVKHADMVVRTALGSYSPEDVSRFEAGTPIQRLFGMFYGFYNTKANVLGTEFAKTVRDQGLKKGAGRLLFLYTMGFAVPAILGGGIRMALAGKPLEDKDDDGPADGLLRLFLGSQVEMAGSMIPIVGRPAATVAVHAMEGKVPKPDDFNILTSPAVKSVTEAAAGATAAPYHAIHDHMVSRADITDILTLIGLLTNTPARALSKPLGYLHDVSTGKATPTGPVDYARGLVTGSAGGR